MEVTLELRPKNIFVSPAKAGLGEREKAFRKEAEVQLKGRRGGNGVLGESTAQCVK